MTLTDDLITSAGRAPRDASHDRPDPPALGGETASVGMVGAGQLARMTHQAAIALGIDLHVMSASSNDPAAVAGARHHLGDPTDLDDLLAFAERCEVITLDHEGVPNAHLHALRAAGHRVRPNPEASLMAQDKGVARRMLGESGFPVPAFRLVERGDLDAVRRFARIHGWPLVLKAATGGYDGRGVEILRSLDDLDLSELAARSPQWLIEAHVPIATELAVVVARRPSGFTVAYPVVETVQRDGICTELVMPARVDEALAARATALAVSIADGIDAAGILAVELFLTDEGRLLVNELATRPHNSGHATIDGCATSQFENHLRGVLDWPLGDTRPLGASATVNLLGPDAPPELTRTIPIALEDPTVHLHLYRKSHAPGRKLGHVTAVAPDPDAALQAARRARQTLLGP